MNSLVVATSLLLTASTASARMDCTAPTTAGRGQYHTFRMPASGAVILWYGGHEGGDRVLVRVTCEADKNASEAVSWVSELQPGDWAGAHHTARGRACRVYAYGPVNVYSMVCVEGP